MVCDAEIDSLMIGSQMFKAALAQAGEDFEVFDDDIIHFFFITVNFMCRELLHSLVHRMI